MDFSAAETSSSVSRQVSSRGVAGELKPEVRSAEAPARREEGEGGANAEQHHKKKKKKDKNKKKKHKEEQVRVNIHTCGYMYLLTQRALHFLSRPGRISR